MPTILLRSGIWYYITMKTSYKALGHGLARAQLHLESILTSIVPMDANTAVLVANYYLKNKLVKLDAIHGTSHVKFGALYNISAIKRCIELVTKV